MKVSLTLVGIIYVSTIAPAHAYIDPITGSFILQALVGGFAAAMVAIKRVRVKILSLFGIVKDETPATSIDETNKEP